MSEVPLHRAQRVQTEEVEALLSALDSHPISYAAS